MLEIILSDEMVELKLNKIRGEVRQDLKYGVNQF